MREFVMDYKGFEIWFDKHFSIYYSVGASLFEPVDCLYYRGDTIEQVTEITDTLLENSKMKEWIPLYHQF